MLKCTGYDNGCTYCTTPMPCRWSDGFECIISAPHKAAARIAALEADLAKAQEDRDRYHTTLAGLLFSGKLDDVTANEIRQPGEEMKAKLAAAEARAELGESKASDMFETANLYMDRNNDLRAKLAAAEARADEWAGKAGELAKLAVERRNELEMQDRERQDAAKVIERLRRESAELKEIADDAMALAARKGASMAEWQIITNRMRAALAAKEG